MRARLHQTVEGKILYVGVFLSVLFLVVLGYYVVVDPNIAKTLFLAFIAHTFGGRAAGIGICIMHDFKPWVTIWYNFFLEILIVCYTYSIFILTVNNYVQVPWMRRMMQKIYDAALRQKDKIKTYGWIGIFLFVQSPFFMTGPVVGSIIGYLIRVPLFKNCLATFGGTFLAILIWFYCFDFMEQRFHVINYIFTAIVILFVISKYKSIKNFFSHKEE